MPLPVRKKLRLPGFDYSTPTSYFVTICAHQKQCIFGEPNQLNRLGLIAQDHLLRLPGHFPGLAIDHSVVMPNHVHILLTLHQQSADLSGIIGSYKAGVSRAIHQLSPGLQVWQKSFHDHIPRTDQDWRDIWTYIDQNPLRWELDCFYPQP